MDKRLIVLIACVMLTMGLTACGQPKTEDLINEAFSTENIWGIMPREMINGLNTASMNSTIKNETIVTFTYSQDGISFEGDAGVTFDGLVKNTPGLNGSDSFLDSKVTIKLPDTLAFFTGFSEKSIPVQGYMRTDGDTIKTYFNRGLFEGRESIWTVSENSISMLTADITKGINVEGLLSTEENLDFIRKTLVTHSVREKKPVDFNGNQVFVFNMELPLSDPEVMDWIIRNAISVRPVNDDTWDAEKVRTAVGQICQLATIRYTYYISEDDHRLVYSKLDYSDIDLNGVLRVLASSLPDGAMESLGDISLQFKSAYIETTNYAYENVSIPESVLNSEYTYDTYNEEYGKGEIVSIVDPDPEPEPEPVKVRVFSWTDNWDDVDFPETGTLGEYGHTDYSLMNLNTFLDDGWEIAGNEEEFEFMPMYNEFYPDTFLYLYDENNAGKNEGLNHKVVGYDIDISYASEDSNIPQFFWNGLTWGTSPGKIEKAYGGDCIKEEAEDYVFLTYSYDIADIEFSFYTGKDENTRKGLYEVIVKYNHVPEPEYELIFPDETAD